MKKILIFVIVCFLVFLVGACSQEEEPQAVLVDGPQVYGLVEDVSLDGKTVLVNSVTDEANGLIWVNTDSLTLFDEEVSGTFEKGNTVGFIVTGGIMESYPMQAYAEVVVFNEIIEE